MYADELLASLKTAAEAIRNSPAAASTNWADTAPSTNWADTAASLIVQLDAHMSAGGLPPRAWHAPLHMVATATSRPQWAGVERAERRLRDVMDRAIRDDEQADRGLMPAVPAVLGAAADPKFRDHLVQLLARAVIREVELEQLEAERLAQQLAVEFAARTAEAANRIEWGQPGYLGPNWRGPRRPS